MSQHPMTLANQAGASFRADLNNQTAALVTQSSGATAPSTTYAYQFWADTTFGLLKQRNSANSAWVTVCNLADWGLASVQAQASTAWTTAGTSTAYTLATTPTAGGLVANQRYRIKLHTPNGAAPTLTRDGLAAKAVMVYNSTGAKVAPAAAGLPTLFDVEFDGTDYVVLNPLPNVFVDANGNVGIGTSLPGSKLDVIAASGVQISASNGTITQRVGYCGFGNVFSGSATNHPYVFLVNDTERMRIDSSGNLIAAASVTGYWQIPVGTTAQRPTGAAGQLRYNSTTTAFEGYNGTAWGPVASGLGDGQTWQNVTGSRVGGTTYTNTTGKPIQVFTCDNGGAGGATSTATVNGVSIHTSFSVYTHEMSFIVPPGASYSCTFGYALAIWAELR